MKYHINDRVEIVNRMVGDYDPRVQGSKGVIHAIEGDDLMLRMWETPNTSPLLRVPAYMVRHTDRKWLRRWYKRFAISAWGCWCNGPCDHLNPDDPSGAKGWQRVKQLIVNLVDSTIYPMYPK